MHTHTCAPLHRLADLLLHRCTSNRIGPQGKFRRSWSRTFTYCLLLSYQQSSTCCFSKIPQIWRQGHTYYLLALLSHSEMHWQRLWLPMRTCTIWWHFSLPWPIVSIISSLKIGEWWQYVRWNACGDSETKMIKYLFMIKERVGEEGVRRLTYRWPLGAITVLPPTLNWPCRNVVFNSIKPINVSHNRGNSLSFFSPTMLMATFRLLFAVGFFFFLFPHYCCISAIVLTSRLTLCLIWCKPTHVICNLHFCLYF